MFQPKTGGVGGGRGGGRSTTSLSGRLTSQAGQERCVGNQLWHIYSFCMYHLHVTILILGQEKNIVCSL